MTSTPRWTPDLSVGHKELDRHHQTLFDLLARLDHGLETGQGTDWAQAMGQELTAYADYHFQAEEALLEAADYPFLQFHRATHQPIALRMHALVAQLAGPPLDQAVRDLRDFVADWLAHHIEIEDFEYKPYLDGNA